MQIEGTVNSKEQFHSALGLLNPDSILLVVDDATFEKAFNHIKTYFTRGFDINDTFEHFELIPVDTFVRRLSTKQLIKLNYAVNPNNTKQIEQIIDDTDIIEACKNLSPAELENVLRDCYGYDRFIIAYDTNSQCILVCH